MPAVLGGWGFSVLTHTSVEGVKGRGSVQIAHSLNYLKGHFNKVNNNNMAVSVIKRSL